MKCHRPFGHTSAQIAVAAPKEILDLVARFELQLDSYKSGQCNETQLRREFLDPFFKALGWDVDNNHTARTPQEKTSLERQIAATDAQIDRLVYELYQLTPEEIAIVEGTHDSQTPESNLE